MGADLIAMTTHGGSPVTRWLMEAVTEHVLRLSPVPVLISRSQTQMHLQARVKKILVPVDGSELSESILPWVDTLARFHRAKILCFHVIPPQPGGVSAAYAILLRRLTDRMLYVSDLLKDRGIVASFGVGRGDPTLEILKKSSEGFDLIATTTRGLGGIKQWLLGSVAEKVIHGANVAVFVYKTARAAKRNEPELEMKR